MLEDFYLLYNSEWLGPTKVKWDCFIDWNMMQTEQFYQASVFSSLPSHPLLFPKSSDMWIIPWVGYSHSLCIFVFLHLVFLRPLPLLRFVSHGISRELPLLVRSYSVSALPQPETAFLTSSFSLPVFCVWHPFKNDFHSSVIDSFIVPLCLFFFFFKIWFEKG